MVTIIGYRVSQNSEGEKFCSLILQGGIEMVQSKQTGRFYATAKKASVSSTFDEATCKQLVGTQMKGGIAKENTEAYEYAIPDTGEIISLDYRYVYVPEAQSIEEEVFA